MARPFPPRSPGLAPLWLPRFSRAPRGGSGFLVVARGEWSLAGRSISKYFSDPQRGAHTHFSGTRLANTRPGARGGPLLRGWARPPGGRSRRLSGGQGSASKAAYPLLGRPHPTPDALPGPPESRFARRYRPPARTCSARTRPSWPEAARHRPGLGPMEAGPAPARAGGGPRWGPPPGRPMTRTRSPGGPPGRCRAAWTSRFPGARPCPKPRKPTPRAARAPPGAAP